MVHELWVDGDGLDTFCLAGPMGEEARALLAPGAKLVWTVEASCHFEAMRRYYEYRGLGDYTTESPEIDRQTYAERGWE